MKINYGTLRIICVGNRFIADDSAGPMVYDTLMKMEIPENITVFDGGLAGINLLNLIEGAKRVVFVDSVEGFAAQGNVVILQISDVNKYIDDAFSHNAGLTYLFKVLSSVIDGPIPEIFIVGVEGRADKLLLQKAAEISIKIIENGFKFGEEI